MTFLIANVLEATDCCNDKLANDSRSNFDYYYDFGTASERAFQFRSAKMFAVFCYFSTNQIP